MSKNYEKVKDFYDAELWSMGMVRNAVDRWITADEFQEITGKEYEKKSEGNEEKLHYVKPQE